MLFLSWSNWLVITFSFSSSSDQCLGESSFSIDHLRELCEQLQLSSKSPVKIPPKKEITDYMILKIDPVLTHRQRIYKFGRFIGQKGRHIALLQKKLNVRIDILNDKSSKNFRQIINKFQTSTKPNDMSSLSIIIIRKDKDQNIDQIKESIQQNWKQIDVTTRKKRSTTIRSAASLTDISLDGDTRWTAVKKSKGKRKEKRNEMIEQEDIQPQPTFRPISMPKELPNRRKTNRK